MQVSEKIQSVQEGERPPATPPPWGYSDTTSQDSIESPDSAKESPAQSLPTTPHESKDAIGGAPADTSKKAFLLDRHVSCPLLPWRISILFVKLYLII